MLRSLSDDLLSLLLPGRCPGCGVRAEPVCASCAASMRVAAPAPTGAGGHMVGGRVRVRGRRSGARCACEVPQRTGSGSLAGRAARAVLCECTVPVRCHHVGPGERTPARRARSGSWCLARACGRDRARRRAGAVVGTRRRSAADRSCRGRASGRPGPARASASIAGSRGARDRRCRDHGCNAGCSGASTARAGRVPTCSRPRLRARRVRRSALGTLPILRRPRADDLGGDDGHRRGRQAQ